MYGKHCNEIFIDPPGHGQTGGHYFHTWCQYVRPKNVNTLQSNVGARKTKYALQRTRCLNKMTTYWLWPGGSYSIHQTCICFDLKSVSTLVSCSQFFHSLLYNRAWIHSITENFSIASKSFPHSFTASYVHVIHILSNTLHTTRCPRKYGDIMLVHNLMIIVSSFVNSN